MKRRFLSMVMAAAIAAGTVMTGLPAGTVYAAETSAQGADKEQDDRPRAIITTDLECDDMNSLIHLCLFFNDVDVDGVVYSASQFHFVGDGGEHTLSEVNPDYLCEGNKDSTDTTPIADYTECRPMPIGWIEDLWANEYAQAYPHLKSNDSRYPSPEYLKSITKVGNVQFEGDVRYDTEGSNLIKEAILDDDPRSLYLFSWGGFNTVARALMSIADDYQNTDQWDAIRQKIYGKVVISGYSQDNSYKDHIQALYPDLTLMETADGYCGYFTAHNGQEDSRYTFQSDWLKKNIKFNHGALMGKYGLMGDGTYYYGEPEMYQYGQTLTIDWQSAFIPAQTFDQYDFLAEGDSGGFMALIPVGLRAMENAAYGSSYAGKVTYTNKADTRSFAEKMFSGEVKETHNYNYVTGEDSDSTNRYLLAYQQEWAARADWCIDDYKEANHGPKVTLDQYDYTAAPGETISLNVSIKDPDGDNYTSYWWTDAYVSNYSGDSKNPQVWDPVSASTSFTVPKDAKSGDTFVLNLQVQDDADSPMTRYAQVFVTVQ